MAFLRVMLCIAIAGSFEVQLHRAQPSHNSRVEQSLALMQKSQLSNLENVRFTQMQYSGQLYIGTPPQNFSVVFDTASAWTWVNDVVCGSDCRSAAAFDPSQSSSCVFTETSVTLPHGEGCVAYETVSLSPSGHRVANQAIALMKSNERDSLIDGVLVRARQGLGFSKQSNGLPTFVDSLKAQGVIESASFAIYLSDRNLKETEDPHSAISFGTFDLKKYAITDFTYLSIPPNTDKWTVPIASFSIAGKLYLQNTTVTFDSSSRLITVPPRAYSSLRKSFCGSFDCVNTTRPFLVFLGDESSLLDVSDFAVILGETRFALPPHGYISCSEPGVLQQGECMLLMHSANVSHWVLGQVFLRQYYALFDADHRRVGLAKSVNLPPSRRAWWAIVVNGIMAVGILAGVVVALGRAKGDDEELRKPLLGEQHETR